MEKRFRALRFIGTLYKILAWIALAGSILVALFLVLSGVLGGIGASQAGDFLPGVALGGAVAGIVSGLSVLIGGVIWFLAMYAVAEGIYVVLSIEENSRITAMALAGRAAS